MTEPLFHYEEQRIASVTDVRKHQAFTFSNDDQKHLVHIDYDDDRNASLRFEQMKPARISSPGNNHH